jgi:hypothetical protein
MDNGMPVAFSPEQRSLVEEYLATADGEQAAFLWRNIIGARGAGVAWKEISWLAEMHGVPEETVEAFLIGLDVIDGDGQSRDRLMDEGDPWTAFGSIGVDVPKPRPAPRAIASRDDVRAAYDAAIRDIEAVRGTQQFEDGFHGRVADAVFDACYNALEHHSAWVEQRGPAELATTAELRATGRTQANTVQPRLHVVSAPMGAGKTTFTIAFIVGLTRMSNALPTMPYGCVFLVDQIPKAEAAQGLQLAPTSRGALASMTALNNAREEVDGLWEGHLLRWNKQMALRGRGRVFDGQGVCGKQKLIFTGDYERLLLYKDRMFPGAKLTTSRQETPLSNWKTRRRQLVEILSSPKLTNTVTTNEIASLMQVKAWRDVSKEVMAGDTRDLLKALGWTYVSKQGRGGSWFERIGAQGRGADEAGQAVAAE